MSPQLNSGQINSLSRGQFTATFGAVFEDSPWIADAAWAARPFADVDQLHRALCAVMYAAPGAAQLDLIRAHPDLVGRAALAGTLTRASTGEQASAGLDRLSPDEIADFTRLNATYWEKFGFPFVICVRENKKEGILSGFATRLSNSRDQEITTALGEIAKIAYLRLRDIWGYELRVTDE